MSRRLPPGTVNIAGRGASGRGSLAWLAWFTRDYASISRESPARSEGPSGRLLPPLRLLCPGEPFVTGFSQAFQEGAGCRRRDASAPDSSPACLALRPGPAGPEARGQWPRQGPGEPGSGRAAGRPAAGHDHSQLQLSVHQPQGPGCSPAAPHPEADSAAAHTALLPSCRCSRQPCSCGWLPPLLPRPRRAAREQIR